MGKDWRKTTLFWAISGVLLGTISWAFYRLIYQGASDTLAKLGVSNSYAQNGAVIVIALIVLLILGVSGKKILKKVTN